MAAKYDEFVEGYNLIVNLCKSTLEQELCKVRSSDHLDEPKQRYLEIIQAYVGRNN